MMDQRERAENTEPTLAAEPIEKSEASEPADATDRIERHPPGSSPPSRSTESSRSTRCSGSNPKSRVSARSQKGSASQHSGPRAQPDGEGRLDWQPVNWTEAERAKGQAWGLKTITSFHIHGMPPVAGHSDNQNQDS